MADLFTRLVSGPASSAWLSPRIPTVHEPDVHEPDALTDVSPWPDVSASSDVDELKVDEVKVDEVEVAERMVRLAALAPRPVALDVPAVPPVTAVDADVVLPGVPEPAPAAPEEPGDLARLWLPQLPQTYKILPALRPREPEVSAPQRQAAVPEPARTTVRIEIGRIEIRAPQQPAALPAPARESRESREPQGLSLADYLRGNDGRPR